MAKIENSNITFDEQEFMALYNASGTRQGLIDALAEMRNSECSRKVAWKSSMP